MRIGLHLDDVPHAGLSALEAVTAAVGPVEVVHWFQAWGGGYGPFHDEWLDRVTASGRVGLITWEPWALTGEAVQPDFAPSTIAEGRHDRYIRSWAEALARRTDGPWYLRPMHEMNGDWYPWAPGLDSVTAADFVAAWRHIRAVFADVGAGPDAVRWVWCPLADDVAGPFEQYHPGVDHVDVLALDGYNWGASRPEYGGWRSPSAIFASALDRLERLDPAAPIWLAEVGSAPDGGDKAAWCSELLAMGERRRSVEAVVFFGLDKERDWRIDADRRVADALRSHPRA